MTIRTWVYGQLTSTPSLAALIGDTNPRVFAKKSMTSSVEDTPFIVYKLGNSMNLDLAEEINPDGGFEMVSNHYLQVWVHDYSDAETASYTRIDEVAREVKKALHNGTSPADGLINCKFLEISQDFNDETLNTVMRYLRFYLTIKET